AALVRPDADKLSPLRCWPARGDPPWLAQDLEKVAPAPPTLPHCCNGARAASRPLHAAASGTSPCRRNAFAPGTSRFCRLRPATTTATALTRPQLISGDVRWSFPVGFPT